MTGLIARDSWLRPEMRRLEMRRLALVCDAVLASALAWPLGAQQITGPPPAISLAMSIDTAPAVTTRHRSGSPTMDVVIALTLKDVSVREALTTIEREAGVTFNYDVSLIDSLSQRVSIAAPRITVGQALAVALHGTGMEATVAGLDRIVIAPIPVGQFRVVRGRVFDVESAHPVSRAVVTVRDLPWLRTTTTDSGTYRLDSLPPGTLTLSIHALGYAPATRATSLPANEMRTINFTLEPAAGKLETVVVTSTITPTAVKALPSPITVVTATQFADLGLARNDEIFRGLVPGAIAWDLGNQDYLSSVTVRGASSLTYNFIKTYIDGVEVADARLAMVDPNSIERVEIIRGPEASTIYGSDASGGVMQIFTKKGDMSLNRPVLDASVTEGLVQGPTSKNALTQDYAASLNGGSPDVGYTVGGSYRHVGAWIPDYYSTDPSIYGGARVIQGPFVIDFSGRYFQKNFPFTNSPALQATGVPELALPLNTNGTVREQTLGTHIAYAPIGWWQNNLTVGYDHSQLDYARTKPQLSTPADSLLLIYQEQTGKISVAYNTTLSVPLNEHWRTDITVGVDHYEMNSTGYGAQSLPNVVGTINADTAALSAATVTNSGYFAQAQFALDDALFLTGGLRVEQNTPFTTPGSSTSPRVGAAYTREFGLVKLKTRVSYGEGIRLPAPANRDGYQTPGYTQLANANLGPERQAGVDGGIDMEVGTIGSFSATYYSQLARELVEQVEIVPGTFQFQNVGRIRNAGWEFDGGITTRRLMIHGEFSIASSTVQALGPNYSGDLQIGDQVLGVPKLSGGATVTIDPGHRTVIIASVFAVGHWTSYNEPALLAASDGYVPALPSLRDYWEVFPAFAKANITICHRLSAHAAVQLQVNNVTNNRAVELNQTYATAGRTTLLALQLRY
jgi:outer membrane receptor protein involved in Fe transport